MSPYKLYIVVREEVAPYMVPTLVAHTILNADTFFREHPSTSIKGPYLEWKQESYRKVVVSANKKEWAKILNIPNTYFGYEKTQVGGDFSCAIIPIMESYPNVIKFAKMWNYENK